MLTHEHHEEARFQCRHILADGRRCRAVCLRHEEFCYYHHTSRKPVANPVQRRSRRAAFTMPRIEDRASVLAAVNQVVARIAANDIDPRRAGRILYAIQIARGAMPRLAAVKPIDSRYDEVEPGLVEEVVQHPAFGEIAPRLELDPPVQRKSLAQSLREEMEALEARNIAEFGASAEDADDTAAFCPTQSGDELSDKRGGIIPACVTTPADLEGKLCELRGDLAKANAQLAEARAETLQAEEALVWHMDRHSEARAKLELLNSAQPLPETIYCIQAVASSPNYPSVKPYRPSAKELTRSPSPSPQKCHPERRSRRTCISRTPWLRHLETRRKPSS